MSKPSLWEVTVESPRGHVRRLVGGAPDDQEARNLADDERIDRLRRGVAIPWTHDPDGAWRCELTDRRVLVCKEIPS